MKQLINIIIWLFKMVFKSKNRQMLEATIIDCYQMIANENLSIRSELIRVKKGKKRYSLLFLHTPDGTLRFNLGRHWEDKGRIEITVN